MDGWNPERAKELIELRGRTRKWVASMCGVRRMTFNHYLTGRRNPSKAVLYLMAQALETTIEDLWPGIVGPRGKTAPVSPVRKPEMAS